MKLYLNDASPYARLVRVALCETGRHDDIELRFVDPWNADTDFLTVSPASKVPALELEDGTSLIESGCIVDYLMQQDVGAPLRPDAAGGAEFRQLGLARALIDCAFASVVQERFAPGSALCGRWRDAVPRLLRTLEAAMAGDAVEGPYRIGHLTAGVALDYVEFRLPEVAWRPWAPVLAALLDRLRTRPSFTETSPATETRPA